MKKNYILSSLFLIAALVNQLSLKGQCTLPPTPTITSTGACGNNFPLTATLTASGTSSLQTSWYVNSFGGNAVATGSNYATPSLTNATVYYVAQLDPTSTASLSLPAQSSTFSGNTRGYYFTAPVSFVITGVRVPTDASSGNSNIAIMKFPTAPPLYSATTNTFDILYLTQNNTSGTGTISVNIPVYAGDIIGVLGDRADINSYALAPSTQSLGTNTLTLERLGMQFPLSSNPPQQLWTEAGGSISRVELYTNLGCLNSLTAYTVNANPNPTVSIVANTTVVCSGNPVDLAASGADTYSWSAGSNSSTLTISPSSTTSYSVTGTNTLTGCFSTAVTSVSVNATPTITVNSGAICTGQSFTMVPSGANTYTYSNGTSVVTPTVNATYSVSGTSLEGCASNMDAVSNVTVNALPTVSAVTNNTLLCVGQTATLSATGALTYTWSTTDNTTDIAVSPTVQATYTVQGTDANGCSSSATVTQNVSLCTGINSINNNLVFNVYPNPNVGLFEIELSTEAKVVITNPLGQIIISETLFKGKNTIDIQNQSTGIYFVKVIQDGQQQIVKLIKK